MPRRKRDTLLPLETEILAAALSLHDAFHGFGLAQTMREHSGARALTGHGTLYKALGRLEEFGLLSSSWEDAAAAEGRPRRRLYELTAKGARVAEQALDRQRTIRPRCRRRVASERRIADPSAWPSWWRGEVRFYTRNLPAPIAERRIDEIDADLHDHVAHERAHGTPDPRIARGIAARTARGLAADVSWARSSTPKEVMKMKTSVVRVALDDGVHVRSPRWLEQSATATPEACSTSSSRRSSWREPVPCSSWRRGSRARSPPSRAAAIGVAAIALAEADRRPRPRALRWPADRRHGALAVRTAQRGER